jgi:NADH-quinone oxidoreductase subunit N
MTCADLTVLLPLLVTAGSAIVVMLAIAIRRHHGLTLALTLAGLGAGLACLSAVWSSAPRTVAGLLVIDHYALFYTALILAAALVTALLSYGYLETHRHRKEEFYILLILATAGAAVMASSAHFATFFLGLELLTVSLYALIAYERGAMECIEAGIKYLVLAGASSAFVIFGMALVYADLGTMQFGELARAAAKAHGAWAMAGAGLMVVGIGFKLALVPFHLWTPDVYEGAPAPVTGFLATVSKGATFALLLRFLSLLDLRRWGALPTVLAVTAAASMFAGNLLALRQNNVKRILAYSSIAHLGYLLVALLAGTQAEGGLAGAGGRFAAAAVTFYLTAYFATTLGAFGVVTVLSAKGRDAGDLEEYRGLIWRRPDLGGIFTVMLLSLAGIPLTAGFVGKFYLVAAGVGTGLWSLVGILVVNSAIGLYYYLRIIVVMCRRSDETAVGAEAARPALAQTASLALLAVTVAVIWLGVYPGPMIDVIRVLFFGGNW